MLNDQNTPKSGHIRKENVQRIIQAAEVEFAQFGFKGASMLSIAKRADLPRPNVHYYYKSKLDLYMAVLMDILELWNAAFTHVSAADEPGEALSSYIRAKVMYAKSNPLASKIYANEMIHGAPHLSEYMAGDYRRWVNDKSQVIMEWISQGKMDPVDPFYLLFLIWGATQHYSDFSIQVNTALDQESITDQDYEKIADNLCHIILKGCGIQGAAILNRQI